MSAGKWELTELETDGAMEGDVGLVMSVSQSSLLCHTPCFQLLTSSFHCSKQPSTTPLLLSWINLSPFKAQKLSLFSESHHIIVILTAAGRCDLCPLCSLPLPRYEVNFQTGLSCGGAYMKLLSDEADSDLV